jgi:quinol monooxygenase YgiN
MSIVLVATIVPVPEHRAEVIAAFEAVITRVHAEDVGCELYALHEADDRLVMIEKWASQDALDAHGKGTALRELNKTLAGKVAGAPDLRVLRPHPAGTTEQGAL